MEENYSDTEHIIAGKKKDKFQHQVFVLRALILVLLSFGALLGRSSSWNMIVYGVLAVFCLYAWNNNSNEILRALSVTGLVTIFASIIGIYGCHRCLRHIEVVRTTKMKESPGQEALLIFFYFNFVILSAFLLFGTYCLFYQNDAMAWLEAKYTDKAAWERDFKGISLATVQDNLKLILTIAGIGAYVGAGVSFACVQYSLRISMAFETIHTVIQVQNMVLVLLAFAIINCGAVAANYYVLPLVANSEPLYLPLVLIWTGIAMILVAFLGFFSSKAEHRLGLITYIVLSCILMANLAIFTCLVTMGSNLLQTSFEERCMDIMPFFHRNFFESFGCNRKYTQNSTEYTYLSCPKQSISSVWETTVAIDVTDQGDLYGCLNVNCCEPMISFVKSKFDFLAAFCIVAFFFLFVSIISVRYMYKKIRRYQTLILSHQKDQTLFIFLVMFSIAMAILTKVSLPGPPEGPPQPVRETSEVTDYFRLYDAEIDNQVGVGYLGNQGWITFDRIKVLSVDDSKCPDCNSLVSQEIVIKATPVGGEFRVHGAHSKSATFDQANNTIFLKGSPRNVTAALQELEYRPGCIFDQATSYEVNVTYNLNKRMLEASHVDQLRDLQDSESQQLEFGKPITYNFKLNLNSGEKRLYRGKFIEQRVSDASVAKAPYFKELSSTSDAKLTVSTPYSKKCAPITPNIDSHGIFEFNMTLLNQSIPYVMRLETTKPGFDTFSMDYFVGGYPHTGKVEMGSYLLLKTVANKSNNVTGRIFEADTNLTFSKDTSITVYKGYGTVNDTFIPYEKLFLSGGGMFYTGFFELYDLPNGPYCVITEAEGYINNLQRFYALPSPPFAKSIRPLAMVPELEPGQLALVLEWGYSPRDLDLHVEFVGGPTILCKCDFSMHECGGVRLLSDTTEGGDKGADVILFDYVGDFSYIVYVSIFNHKHSPKQSTGTEEPLSESQAQLKVFAPFYEWPVYIFDVPAHPASQSTYTYWTAFCFNGREGLKGLVPINQMTQGAPDVATCHNIFGTPDALFMGQEP